MDHWLCAETHRWRFIHFAAVVNTIESFIYNNNTLSTSLRTRTHTMSSNSKRTQGQSEEERSTKRVRRNIIPSTGNAGGVAYTQKLQRLNEQFQLALGRVTDEKYMPALAYSYLVNEQAIAYRYKLQPSTEVLLCGSHENNQLGLLPADISVYPTNAAPLTLSESLKGIRQVAAGGQHFVAVDNDGRAWTWGVTDEGCLGRDTSSDGAESPAVVPGLPLIESVAASEMATYFVSKDGKVYMCGLSRDIDQAKFTMPGPEKLDVKGFREKPVLMDSFPQKVVRVYSGCSSSIAAAVGEDGTLYTWGKTVLLLQIDCHSHF